MRPKNIAKEEAIKRIALEIIAEEGLENLSMQKLAKEAGISPRTIYLKYANKEDLLIRLFIEEVLAAYEAAVLKGFDAEMDFAAGVGIIWKNGFDYLTQNRTSFALIQHGKASPLLNKAYQANNIRQGQFFAPVHRFLERHTAAGAIRALPFEVQRALLFAPLMDLVNEYFDHLERPEQIITPSVMRECCAAAVRGMMV